jgi:diguanylate cyclase (GGDEF)-like protein
MAENRLMTSCDALTGLPDRTMLLDRLTAASRGRCALLVLGLDGFRDVNHAFGHDVGDAVLRTVASRLSGSGDFVARLGGDEFAVVHAAGSQAEARLLARALVEAVRAPIEAPGATVVVDATAGIALAPAHGRTAGQLLRHAEIALGHGKRRPGGVWVYDVQAADHPRGRLELLADLSRAITDDELVVAYQPKIDLETGALAGVEALVRWQHPDHGLLGPGTFIPAAERTSIVLPLTLQVLAQSLGAHRRWREGHGVTVPVAVNLAGACVMDPSLPEHVAGLLRRDGVAPEHLTLELTERTMMSDLTVARDVLGALHGLGVRLSLDDFGAGQTSLGQLQTLPLHELKIDRSIVIGDPRLLAGLVEIAHGFGLATVGEGVETTELAEVLATTGCDQAQGFLYARPMWASELPGWIDARHAQIAA